MLIELSKLHKIEGDPSFIKLVSGFNIDLNSSKQNEKDNVKHKASFVSKGLLVTSLFCCTGLTYSHPKLIISKRTKGGEEREREEHQHA